MKALFFTNEYPPLVYGGAGVHVEYLTKELAKLMEVEVRCFGDQNSREENLTVKGFSGEDERFSGTPKAQRAVFTTLQRCLGFAGTADGYDVVHCHTWYTHMAGIWAKLNFGIPLVITTHSLEPLRPWKREQLGGGYDFSCWVERNAIEMADAIIAVSNGTKQDILQHFKVCPDKIKIIYNGIATEEFNKVSTTQSLKKYGIDPSLPYILFVGRITRQKGIIHLVRAIPHICPNVQVVLCAGAPDTPEIAEEMKTGVEKVQAARKNVVWIREMVDRKTLIELYSNAAVFCCPSIYEPFGIINLEAMACGVPVVAAAVGGIPEVVVDGDTGYLVRLDQMNESPFEALNPEKFSRDLAERMNHLIAHPEIRERMGKSGRKRTEELFSWKSIAHQTFELYQSLKKACKA